VLLDGAELGAGCLVRDSLVGPVKVVAGDTVEGMFLWPGESGPIRIPLHDSSQRRDPAVK
jgi:hypothetical protein